MTDQSLLLEVTSINNYYQTHQAKDAKYWV